MTRITGTLHEDLSVFMLYPWIIPRMRNVSDKSSLKIKTHILFSTSFIRKLCCLWDNVEKYRTGYATNEITGHAHFVLDSKAKKKKHTHTHTHSEYATLIAFPLQQWLHERTATLRWYVHCLSCCILSGRKYGNLGWLPGNLLLLLLWRYNSGRVLAFSKISFHLRRSWTCSAHFISSIFFKSFLTSSSHRDLGFPTGLPVNDIYLQSPL